VEVKEDWKKCRVCYLPNFRASNFPIQLRIQNFNVYISYCLKRRAKVNVDWKVGSEGRLEEMPCVLSSKLPCFQLSNPIADSKLQCLYFILLKTPRQG
jgi:hypothetical protein